MAKFLTTNGNSFYIEEIILEARKKIVLVSPYLDISKTFFERLKDATSRGVEIQIIYGKNELNKEKKDKLNGLPNLKLYFFENLHAKCYFNEKKMIISSMNMYEFSEKNNREMGVLIIKSEDAEIYDSAFNEVQSIIDSSNEFKMKSNGFCIRCAQNLNLNGNFPYCSECYEIWNFYENRNYLENFCHKCKKEGPSSMNKPFCPDCFNKADGTYWGTNKKLTL